MKDKFTKFTESIKEYEAGVTVEKREDGVCVLSGTADTWGKVVQVGVMAQKSGLFGGVVNDVVLRGYKQPPMRMPSFSDDKYDGKKVDVLVIGGGITGCAILRELSRYDIKCSLAEKENDLALHASSRNDGMVHIGIDISGKPKKLEYIKRANPMFDKLCADLDVKFERTGQYVMFDERKMLALVPALAVRVKKHGIGKFHYLSGKKMRKTMDGVSDKVKFALFFPETGIVCPYGLTIALAENAVANGSEVMLSTAVLGMERENGKITAVLTNRGRIYPKVVINAAGAFCDKVAEMAGDRFYTVHPRKGTSFITDKADTAKLASVSVAMMDNRLKNDKKSHTKGGGLVTTADGNILVGPDAKEVPYREDFSVDIADVTGVLNKQKSAVPKLSTNNIITYFSGIRASTYEEDFIIERGRATRNFVHAAGIQSPGLTAAPAIAEDIVEIVKEILNESGEQITEKADFKATRKAPPRIAEMPLCDRAEYIKRNPDYGRIVCRCEEISKGEIIDCLKSAVPPSTVDGVKRRVRAGMGRCQGGFCQPHVLEIMHEVTGLPYTDIPKKGEGVIITREK